MSKQSGKVQAKSWQPPAVQTASFGFSARPFPEIARKEEGKEASLDLLQMKENQPGGMIDNINRSLASASPPARLPILGLLGVQAKLTLGTVGDVYEQEADRVARQVVDEIHSSAFRASNTTSEGESIAYGGEAGRVQRQITVRAAGDAGGEISSEWETQLQGAKGGGQPLSPSVKEPMERAFGADFGGVRVHTGVQADKLARSIQAKAFTTGQDVFFRQGAYEPGSRGGQELIAHELTHVEQQKGKGENKKEKPRMEERIQRVNIKKLSTEGETKTQNNNEDSVLKKDLPVKDHIVLINTEKGNYIFGVKRPTSRYTGREQTMSWELIGGKRDKGMSPEENIRKELKEETANTYELMKDERDEHRDYENIEKVEYPNHKYVNHTVSKGVVKEREKGSVDLKDIDYKAMENEYIWEVSIEEIIKLLEQKEAYGEWMKAIYEKDQKTIERMREEILQDIQVSLMIIFRDDCENCKEMKPKPNYDEVNKVVFVYHTHKKLKERIMKDIELYQTVKDTTEKHYCRDKELVRRGISPNKVKYSKWPSDDYEGIIVKKAREAGRRPGDRGGVERSRSRSREREREKGAK
ncbi:MAG: DUF4157 domain-containing protein [Nostoc sp.]|uniref:eCIS core domain-containing protein n=1 Tax=Nostoc sp. TaxID=1180 RepID=UPI002FEFDCFA